MSNYNNNVIKRLREGIIKEKIGKICFYITLHIFYVRYYINLKELMKKNHLIKV